MIDQEDHINLPPIEVLLDYLDGILDPASRLKIEEQIKSSDQLSSTIEGIRYYYEIKGYNRAQIEEYIQTLQMPVDDDQEDLATIKIFSFRRIAAGIALLISAGVAFFYLQKPSANEMVQEELSFVYPVPATFRGERRSYEELWGEASTTYADGQYGKAIGVLMKIDEVDGESPDSWFYLGLSYLYSNPPNIIEATKYLSKVVASPHRLADRAQWFLALSNYKKGDVDATKEFLNDIITHGGYKSEEAMQLLSKLE